MKRSRLLATLTATISIAALGEVIIGVPLTDAWGAAYVRTAAGFVALLAAALYTVVWHVRPVRRSHRETEIIQLGSNRAYELQRLAGKMRLADASQVKFFTLAVVQPAEIRMRIVERFEPRQRTIRSRVSIDGHIPVRILGKGSSGLSEGPARVLFPAILPRKGHLLDNFELRDEDGKAVPVLAYREYLELVAQTLRTMLVLAYTPIDGLLSEEVRQAEHLALCDVIHRGLDKELQQRGGANALRALRGAVNPGYLQLAARLDD